MPRKILIVDDVSINRRILSGMLSNDYDVVEAANGEEALDVLACSHRSISAVLLDLLMPGMDGIEVLRRIRADRQLYQLPVIMITGSDDESSRAKCLLFRANGYITKPYKSDAIKRCLRNNIALIARDDIEL